MESSRAGRYSPKLLNQTPRLRSKQKTTRHHALTSIRSETIAAQSALAVRFGQGK